MSQLTSEPPNSYKALKFELEVSARYFDYRRSSLGVRVTIVRLISLLGSILSLLAISYFIESKEKMATVVLWISVFIGLANLVDLVFQFDADARASTSFFQRYKALLGEMARHQSEWGSRHAEWEAETQAIRSEEPPTYWALYAIAWNQTLEKHDLSSSKRPLRWWQHLSANWFHFRPDQFKAA
jgi:hypothetical protein